MWWVSTPFLPAPHVSLAQICSCPVMLQSIILLYHFSPVNCEAHNEVKLTPSLVCAPVPFARWSSSRSTYKATRWCTGLHQRDCRGQNGLCLKCARPGKTAPSCRSFGRESHMNSKSAPSSTSSREQTVMSKLARRWRKVGGMLICVCDCVPVCFTARSLACVQACFHVYTILYAQLVWVRVYNSCSQQAVRPGLCYVQMWCIQACWAGCSDLLKGPMETHIQHSSASVVLIFHRVWLWRVSWGLVETQLQISICNKHCETEVWVQSVYWSVRVRVFVCLACVGVFWSVSSAFSFISKHFCWWLFSVLYIMFALL